MTYVQAILILLKACQPDYGDKETEEARDVRLGVIARSIDTAAFYGACEDEECDDRSWSLFEQDKIPKESRLTFTALLVTLGRFESCFTLHVHANKCRVWEGECDRGRARSPWQIHSTLVTHPYWSAYKGADPDSTATGAFGALVAIVHTHKSCHTWKGAIAGYATGTQCTWEHAQVRYDTFLQVRGRLAELLAVDDLDVDEDSEDDESEDE
jgi:hypothetical protein